MRAPIGSIFRSVIKNFGESRIRFNYDRFLVDSVINNLIPISDEMRAATRAISLTNCRGVVVTPLNYESDRNILFCHGGAFCFSLTKFYLPFVYELAVQTRSKVLMPDYRLSPENTFPAALNDCLDGYKWITNDREDSKVFILGDSAGGNLAFNVTERLGGRGIGLLSPWLDLTQSSQLWNQECDDDVVQPESARRAAWFYVKGDDDWSFGQSDPANKSDFLVKVRDPSVSPIFGSLEFLKRTPLLLQVSDSERLFCDAALLWERIGGTIPNLDHHRSEEPNVKFSRGCTQLSVWFDQPHVWQVVRRRSRPGKLANIELAKFINSTLD
jgi:monoterpene epsilon-lactone hydrolase